LKEHQNSAITLPNLGSLEEQDGLGDLLSRKSWSRNPMVAPYMKSSLVDLKEKLEGEGRRRHKEVKNAQ
jgi:hypothetical protein